MHNHSWFIFYINLFLLKQKEYCMLYFKKVIFWLWNCKYAYFGFSVSKFLQKFHILKGDKTNIMAWRFHRIFFIEKRKIIEILKPWCSVVFQVENKMCQEFCNAANGDMYCCSYTINLQVYIVFAFKFFLTVKMPGTLLIVILFINFGDDIVNISILFKGFSASSCWSLSTLRCGVFFSLWKFFLFLGATLRTICKKII